MRIFVEQAAICGIEPHAGGVVPAWATGVQLPSTPHLWRSARTRDRPQALVAIYRSHEKTTVSLELLALV